MPKFIPPVPDYEDKATSPVHEVIAERTPSPDVLDQISEPPDLEKVLEPHGRKIREIVSQLDRTQVTDATGLMAVTRLFDKATLTLGQLERLISQPDSPRKRVNHRAEWARTQKQRVPVFPVHVRKLGG